MDLCGKSYILGGLSFEQPEEFQITLFLCVQFSKKRKKAIEQKKHVGGSSAVPRVRLNILGTCTGTRTLTKVLESAPSDRQTDRQTDRQ